VDVFRMSSLRPFAASALICAALAAQALPAAAQGRLEAEYEASLGAIVIGKGNWIVDIGADQFWATVSAGTAGVMKSLGSGTGTGWPRPADTSRSQ